MIIKQDITVDYDITKISQLIREGFKITTEEGRVYAVKEVKQ